MFAEVVMFAPHCPHHSRIEPLERRRLLSASCANHASLATATGSTLPAIATRAVQPARITTAAAAATPPDVTGTFTGSARLKAVAPKVQAGKYAVTLTLTDTAGAVSGTALFANLADVAVTGTVVGRHVTLTASGGAT